MGETIVAIINAHTRWLDDASDGVRANLAGADLSKTNLSGADLREANLSGADLSGADLHRADLSGAKLIRADLRGADLRGTDLSWADLREANLSCADLSGADLRGADLRGADLRGADLSWADLSGADLRNTPLDCCRQPKDATAALLSAGLRIIDGMVYGYRTKMSKFYSDTVYKPGRYTAPWFSIDNTTECHPGIYFASMKWLLRNYGNNIDLVPCASWVCCVVAAEDKFRTKELFVLDTNWFETTSYA